MESGGDFETDLEKLHYILQCKKRKETEAGEERARTKE